MKEATRQADEVIAKFKKRLEAKKPKINEKQKLIDEAETKMYGAPLRECIIYLPGVSNGIDIVPKKQYQELYEELLGQGNAVRVVEDIDQIGIERQISIKKKVNKSYGIKKRK